MSASKSTSNRIVIMRLLKPMVSLMGMRVSKLQIFNTIIVSNMIDMMDKFVFSKVSTEFFFHNQSVFVDIFSSPFSSKRMSRGINKNISKRIFYSSTFPYMRFFTAIMVSNSTAFKRTWFRTKQSASRFIQSIRRKTKKIFTYIASQNSSRTTIFTRNYFNNLSIHTMDYIQKKEVCQ